MARGSHRSRVRMRVRQVYHLMNRLNLSQKGLADLACLSPSHLSHILNGRRLASPEARRRLQEALGVEFDEIFEMEDDDDA